MQTLVAIYEKTTPAHFPLGAHYNGKGVYFSVHSNGADYIELCLFDGDGKELSPMKMQKAKDHTWSVYIENIHPGQHYGYRAYGKFDPKNGLLFNPHKLLLDPYAKAMHGMIDWNKPIYGYKTYMNDVDKDLYMDTDDNVSGMMKSIVISSDFDWGNDSHLNIPLSQSVIYELHVKGFTMLHPEVEPHLRGTYAGLASEPIIKYLKKLGITTIELLPVHQFVQDHFLIEKGLRNYWGYNSIGYFAPHNEYSSSGTSGGQVNEFKQMVKTFHENGIEVIIDVVYNHTAEGGQLGPILSFKGLDNKEYYRLDRENKRHFVDYTGTGNTFNTFHHQPLQLVMDSLRYWVIEMHVDGFRFDLGATLGRGEHLFDKYSSFFTIIQQDPILSNTKLIAEPWDMGEDGYQVGGFPILWSDWNGRYRDTVRMFWNGNNNTSKDLAFRIGGSPDIYNSDSRLPHSSINFIVAHDGFTMHDLVSYSEKHNENNKENNNDGERHNNSMNYGVEGETDNKEIIALRQKHKKNLLSTLLLSWGTPMIAHGDEYGRTQKGNNNGYCQDDELTWMNWDWDEEQQNLFDFTSKLIAFRKNQHIFHGSKYPNGDLLTEWINDGLDWFNADGKTIGKGDWHNIKSFGMYLENKENSTDTFIYLVNADENEVEFNLYKEGSWKIIFDTCEKISFSIDDKSTSNKYKLMSKSAALLQLI